MSYQIAKKVWILESPRGYCGALTFRSQKKEHTKFTGWKQLDGKTLISHDVFLNISNFRLLEFSWCGAGCKGVGKIHKLARCGLAFIFKSTQVAERKISYAATALHERTNGIWLKEGRISLFSGCFCKWHVKLGSQVSGVFFREKLEVQTCSVFKHELKIKKRNGKIFF